MEYTEERYINKLKKLLNGILLHKQFQIEQICNSSMMWKMNCCCGNRSDWDKLLTYTAHISKNNSECSLYLSDFSLLKISDELVQSDCLAILKPTDRINNKYENTYEIFAFFVQGKVSFINITELEMRDRAPIYRIRSCNEECYLVEEKDVLYIEACHNQVIWHCSYGIIFSNNSLGHLEELVSDSFVRIQRGYLVNKYNVKHIRRCEVLMNNGDVLSIPCKKYVAVREKLFAST